MAFSSSMYDLSRYFVYSVTKKRINIKCRVKEIVYIEHTKIYNVTKLYFISVKFYFFQY